MPVVPFAFRGSGGRKLSGRLEPAVSRRRGAALFVHCFTCGKASLPAVRLSRALAARGFDTLRFDFAGIGESEGDFAETTFASNLADLRGAAQAMAEAGMPPVLLVGHSLGGAAALAAAAEIESLKAVATIGAPADLQHLEQLLGDKIAAIETEGVAEVDLGGARPARIGLEFLQDLRRHDLSRDVRDLPLPLLILHAPEDRVVEIDSGRRLFQLAPTSASFVSLEGADHLLTRREAIDYASDVLSAWATRHAPRPAGDRPSEGYVEVAETGAGRYQVEVATPSGPFLADEPEKVGGLGSGPTPYELLAGALGACTAMTLRMYAERKSWPLSSVKVEVAHAKQGGRDHFTRRLTLSGDLSDDQKARLAEMAERCPVHRTLRDGAGLETASGEIQAPHGSESAHLRAVEAACDEAG